jgi:hypothetical protein
MTLLDTHLLLLLISDIEKLAKPAVREISQSEKRKRGDFDFEYFAFGDGAFARKEKNHRSAFDPAPWRLSGDWQLNTFGKDAAHSGAFGGSVWYDLGGFAVPPRGRSKAPNRLRHSAFPKV